jgi:hypothetical protein
MVFPFIKSAGLKGAFVPHAKPKLTDSTWFTGEFQRQYEQFLNDTIGFHQDFIRLRNQIDYSVFDKCHSDDIEVGKKGYLVSTWSLDAFRGKLRGREARIDTIVMMLQDLHNTFRKMNKTLLVVLAPGRGTFYKELAPLWYDLTPVHESDYQKYARLLKKTDVNYIDFNNWFLKQKSRSEYPLYTKGGIHWSAYGAAVAADSILTFIEHERNADLPDMTFKTIKMSTKAREQDADMAKSLNLIWELKNDPMAYPEIVFNKKTSKKLNLLVIGDSYYYGILNTAMPIESFNEHSFWYYNNTINTNGPNQWKTTKDIDFTTEVEKHDVIMLIATETTLSRFGWGFIDKAWEVFCTSRGNRMEYYIQKIKSDTAWFNLVKKKAFKYNKPVELQIIQDANYMVEQEKQEK